jgi:phosphonate transport system substrate-binding protein
MKRLVFAVLATLLTMAHPLAPASAEPAALRVLLIPADGGTADGTKSDFKPLFDALSKTTGLSFDVRVGQSYAAVIEGMCAGQADIAWFGPSSFLTAQERGCAELLAVEERNGATTYYAGLFVRADSRIKSVKDLKGRTLALGSSHSASSFAYPLAMLRDAGLDPVDDIAGLVLSESHSQGLMALSLGRVDAAGASLISFERALNQGGLKASDFRILAKSSAIPNPPLAVSSRLPAELKKTLRTALANLHETPGIKADAIRGYGGKPVDRYITDIDADELAEAAKVILFLDDDLKAALLRKAGAPAR